MEYILFILAFFLLSRLSLYVFSSTVIAPLQVLFGFVLYDVEFLFLGILSVVLILIDHFFKNVFNYSVPSLAYFGFLLCLTYFGDLLHISIVGVSFLVLRFICSRKDLSSNLLLSVYQLCNPVLLLSGPIQSCAHDTFKAPGSWRLFASSSVFGLFKVLSSFLFLRVSPPLYDDFLFVPIWLLMPHAWLYGFIFLIGLYLNFSGTIDIVRAGRLLLGQDTVPNFDKPWMSTSFTDFWRRWHMSLGKVLQSGLFLPVSVFLSRLPVFASRRKLSTSVALLALFCGVGAWHGSSMFFLLFGVIHGAGVLLDQFLSEGLKKATFIVINPISFYIFMNGFLS